MTAPTPRQPGRRVQRVQTGVRLEKRIVKVLKGLAEYHEISLGDLLEGIVLHAFEGRSPFSPASLERIERLKEVYGLDLGAEDSHTLVEAEGEPGSAATEDDGGLTRAASPPAALRSTAGTGRGTPGREAPVTTARRRSPDRERGR